MCNGRDSEAFAPFDDELKEGEKPEPPEQPKEEEKLFNWLGVGLAVAGGAAVAIVVSIGLAAVAGISAVAVLACAASAALAATPIGLVGQSLINGSIGFAQAALNGQSASDMTHAFEMGAISGAWGGVGYIPFFAKRFGVAASYYVREAAEAVTPGVIKGNLVSAGDNIANYCANKIQGWFSGKKQENSNAVPAT